MPITALQWARENGIELTTDTIRIDDGQVVIPYCEIAELRIQTRRLSPLAILMPVIALALGSGTIVALYVHPIATGRSTAKWYLLAVPCLFIYYALSTFNYCLRHSKHALVVVSKDHQVASRELIWSERRLDVDELRELIDARTNGT